MGVYGGLGQGLFSQVAAGGVMGMAGARHGFNYGVNTAQYYETRHIKGAATGALGLVAGVAGGLAAKAYLGPVPAAVIMGCTGAALSWFGGSSENK